MRKIHILILLLLVSSSLNAQNEELSWPREVIIEKLTITLYQPQLESFQNNILEGRMAVSVKGKEKDLIFGAIWFKATLETDLNTRIALLKNIDITQTRFPDVDSNKVDEFTQLLEKQIEGYSEEMSLDRILASLELIENQRNLSENLNNKPPDIYYREHPAVLVFIDGTPIYKETDIAGISYVINTPFFLVRDDKTQTHYLRGGKFWYTTNELSAPWKPAPKVPSDIYNLSEKAMEGYIVEDDSLMMALTEAPELIVVTQPSELIFVDGKPDYKTIEGTSLLYIYNTESDIIMDINSQSHYLLLAGRWYFSKSLENGEWKFQEPDQLPDEFKKIPSNSDMGNVRTSIPGTDEANSAVLEQTIPQTATVDRKTATVSVIYDGDPKFKEIDKTSVAYAENADKTVLLISNTYYCIDEAIWFESDKPDGPWVVSVVRPDEIDDIPPESPVYNVKYVYIYDSTPDVVYVGYTPGYTCSYVYGGVVVYGTGYYYNPWYGHYYYPRPVTYGFHVHYNPWMGWGYSHGISYGWISVSYRSSPYGYWGPAGFRSGYYHGYNHGYNHGYGAGYRAGYNNGRNSQNRNMYQNRAMGIQATGVQSRQNVNRNNSNAGSRTSGSAGNSRSNATNGRAGTMQNQANLQTKPSNNRNDVYAGRDGNVYKRENNGNVQQRTNGQWNITNPSTNPSQQINRESQSRQKGNQNYGNYNASRGGASSGTRPAGGGGRRR